MKRLKLFIIGIIEKYHLSMATYYYEDSQYQDDNDLRFELIDKGNRHMEKYFKLNKRIRVL